ncbi:MAG: hypothetical protein WD058_09290, partial [Dehalococcoidia bacterium]
LPPVANLDGAGRRTAQGKERATMGNVLTSIDHGPERITWVYRNQAHVPMAIGRLYAVDDGTGRSGLLHRLLPFRALMPGRYDLTFARYGVAWPVTLRRDEDAEDPRMMLVEGRVPL